MNFFLLQKSAPTTLPNLSAERCYIHYGLCYSWGKLIWKEKSLSPIPTLICFNLIELLLWTYIYRFIIFLYSELFRGRLWPRKFLFSLMLCKSSMGLQGYRAININSLLNIAVFIKFKYLTVFNTLSNYFKTFSMRKHS